METDEAGAVEDSDEDTDAAAAAADDDDDDEFVDAGDEVEDAAERSPWVTERRHSGDGEVTSLRPKKLICCFRKKHGQNRVGRSDFF